MSKFKRASHLHTLMIAVGLTPVHKPSDCPCLRCSCRCHSGDARHIWSQKEINTEVSCFLTRTMSYPLVIGPVSDLNTNSDSQESGGFQKSVSSGLVVYHRYTCWLHMSRMRDHDGFLSASSSTMSTATGYHVKIRIYCPNCLNDWQLLDASSPRAIKIEYK